MNKRRKIRAAVSHINVFVALFFVYRESNNNVCCKKRVEMKSDTSQMQPLFVVLLATN